MSSPRLAACLFLVLAAICARAELKVGFAERDITPEVGLEVPGGYGKSFSKVITDPCKVRASVFDDGKRRVALVGLDALIVPRDLVLAARRQIVARCGVADVMIGASHTHSAGPIGMVQPGEYDHADDLVKDLAYNKSSAADAKYLARVLEAMVAAVVAADAAKEPAQTGFGSGHEATVGFNRRVRMKNGLSFSHPGKNNPDNVEYANPVDPEVGVIGVWDLKGAFKGCVVNFACHATTSSGGIGASWIRYTEKVIQGYYGADAKVVFLQGACGDITQVDNLDPTVSPAADDWSQFVGGRVGAEALKVLLGMSRVRVKDAPVAAASKVWDIPRRVPAPERVTAARELILKDTPKNPDWVWAKETLMLDALIAKHPKVEVEVQAIQVGPVVCISNPAEYFVSYGLQLKKRSGFPLTFPVELCNGIVGYVPDEEAFGPNGGGYETRLTSYSNLEVTAGTQMMEAGVALAKGFKPMPLPVPPKAPVGRPWLYGNQPPQLK